MAKREMVKDNAVIMADEGLAKELELSGWVEKDGGAVAEVPATQPVPYTDEEIDAIDVQVKVEQAKAEARQEIAELQSDEPIQEDVKKATRKTAEKK